MLTPVLPPALGKQVCTGFKDKLRTGRIECCVGWRSSYTNAHFRGDAPEHNHSRKLGIRLHLSHLRLPRSVTALSLGEGAVTRLATPFAAILPGLHPSSGR